jgi:hypothetical protein
MDGLRDQPPGAEPGSLVYSGNVIGAKQAPQHFGLFSRQCDLSWMRFFLHWVIDINMVIRRVYSGTKPFAVSFLTRKRWSHCRRHAASVQANFVAGTSDCRAERNDRPLAGVVGGVVVIRTTGNLADAEQLAGPREAPQGFGQA